MKVEVKTLSPTDMAHNDFYHIQPIQLSLLPQFVSDCQLLPLPVLTKAPERILSLLWHSPPRQYLRLLTTLIIDFWLFSVPHEMGNRRFIVPVTQVCSGKKAYQYVSHSDTTQAL